MNIGEIDCPFCTTIKVEDIIIEGKYTFAIHDRYPVSKGHTLVISKRHCSDYFDLYDDEQREAWELISKLRQKIQQEHTPDGFNIGMNISSAAGQTVPHCHIHVIPRYKGDMKNPRGGIRHCIEGKGYY
jgi:diadenosine tetraphosphate (Ap4A) HIT family hydrolase